MIGPDNRAFEEDVAKAAFRLGQADGRWRLIAAAWPFVIFGVVAQDGRQKLRGVAVVTLERGSVDDADHRLLLVVGTQDRLKRARPARHVRLARRSPRRPVATSRAGQRDDLVPVGLAGEGQHDVLRTVMVGEVVAHVLKLHALDRRDCPEDTLSQWMWAEMRGLGLGYIFGAHHLVGDHVIHRPHAGGLSLLLCLRDLLRGHKPQIGQHVYQIIVFLSHNI